MEKQKGLFERLALPTRIIVNRTEQSPAALDEQVRNGEYSPAGGEVCELEAGGQILARGRIVKRWGRYFLKVMETAGEERR